MTVAVINPHYCLQENRFTQFSKQSLISSPQMKFPKCANPNLSNRMNRMQPNRRKRSPPPPRPQNTTRSAAAPAGGHKVPSKSPLVMGQVKILKRGEELTSTAPSQAPSEEEKKVTEKRDVPDLGSTERLGPDPQSVPTQIRLTESMNRAVVFYAGSAFITSPPPSSLPLPAFFTKKSVSVAVKPDDATSDLRRILKLDLL